MAKPIHEQKTHNDEYHQAVIVDLPWLLMII